MAWVGGLDFPEMGISMVNVVYLSRIVSSRADQEKLFHLVDKMLLAGIKSQIGHHSYKNKNSLDVGIWLARFPEFLCF